jgi:hypothetical protein
MIPWCGTPVVDHCYVTQYRERQHATVSNAAVCHLDTCRIRERCLTAIPTWQTLLRFSERSRCILLDTTCNINRGELKWLWMCAGNDIFSVVIHFATDWNRHLTTTQCWIINETRLSGAILYALQSWPTYLTETIVWTKSVHEPKQLI